MSPSRIHRHALVLLALVQAFATARADAEPVTHEFSGTVMYVSSGQGLDLDLTGLFSNGNPFALSCTIERSTLQVPVDPYHAVYVNASTAISFTLAGFSGSASPPTSTVDLMNDASPPWAPALPVADGSVSDVFVLNAEGLTAPPLGDVALVRVGFDLQDTQAAVFSSLDLPRALPALSEFEVRFVNFGFYDLKHNRSGLVSGEIESATSPVLPGSWGAVKALYRH